MLKVKCIWTNVNREDAPFSPAKTYSFDEFITILSHYTEQRESKDTSYTIEIEPLNNRASGVISIALVELKNCNLPSMKIEIALNMFIIYESEEKSND